MFDHEVAAIQRFYPQIYLACHREHVRVASTAWELSSHDSAILAHLDQDSGMSPQDLRRHLGVTASTLSASLKRLAALGYISNVQNPTDKIL
jgi:DNA-binding MarR family transcriptional regulator